MPEKRDFYPEVPGQPEQAKPPETRLIKRSVASLSLTELFELKEWLDRRRINIRQPLLQKGRVSSGYVQRGAIELGAGRIAFVPNQNNELIEGTPEEFLTALNKIG